MLHAIMQWKTYRSLFIIDNVFCRLNSTTLSKETTLRISVSHSSPLNPVYFIKVFVVTEYGSANRKIAVG